MLLIYMYSSKKAKETVYSVSVEGKYTNHFSWDKVIFIRILIMVGSYKVITLCGSTRFKNAFFEAQKRLTLKGNIIISVGLFGHSGDSEVWEDMDEGALTKTKKMLDDMHKRKIDMADEIFVINVGGYIGSSTKSEIEYAIATGKAVRYLEEK